MDHLPPHVIDTIVSYTIGQDKSKTELRTDDKPVTVPYTLYPLMGICREWRRVASSFIGESAIISINSQDTDSHNGPKHTQSLGPPRLKHMHVDLSDGSGNGLIELVVRNADCLEMLSVEFQSSEPLNKLFHNPADKSPVVYSRLHTFTAPFKNGWRVQDDGCAPTANPFPVLRKFVWKRMCQFRTSSVFRWIQPTVEVMEVHISYQNYEMFVKDGVFDAGSFPNLRRVDLSWYTGPDGISIVDPAGLLPRVLSLSPVLEEVAFDKRVSYACRIVAPLYRCRDLKKLTIAGIQFTIADAIGLINTFPNLRSVVLSLKTSHDVNERGDVSDAEIKEFLGKHNHVVNSQLRTLEISTFVFTTRPRAAQHILLLASIFKSIQGIKIRSLNEKRDAAILGALDEAKQRKCFDNDGEGRLQCIEFSLVKK
ncbi:hypothetical protein EC988_001643 [Linderina pennispora]|nr:hypothetical protein EC988_001643 [Linderina pennispora]